MFPSPLRRAGDFFALSKVTPMRRSSSHRHLLSEAQPKIRCNKMHHSYGAHAAGVGIESGGTTATSIYR
jgi:hypothetical protein